MAENVYYGASFASPHEVGRPSPWPRLPAAVGSDYPHLEGTFVYPDGPCRRDPAALRDTFCDVSLPRHCGWSDRTPSTSTASTPKHSAPSLEEIGAPTLEEVATPIDVVPEGG